MLLAAGALADTTIAFALGGEQIARACAALGASTMTLAVDTADDEGTVAGAESLGHVDVVVCDAASAFAAAGGGYEGLRAAVDEAFLATRALTTTAFAQAGGGRSILIAPAPGAGEHAGPTRMALENTARTLGTEFARLQVKVTAILTGDETTEEELADLVAYLASPAGVYYTGAAFTLN